MLYKGIEVNEVNLIVFLESKSNTNFKENQKLVFEWCLKNGINAVVECPVIIDETLEALVYIYLPSEELVNMELIEAVYEKAEKDFKKVAIAMHLSNFTEEGWNEAKLTLEKFKEIYKGNGGDGADLINKICTPSSDWMIQYIENEVWTGSDYPTKEIAIEEGRSQAIHEIGSDLKPITKFYIGKKRLIAMPSIDVIRLLENLDDDYQDEITPELSHDSYLFENVSREQEEALEVKLNEVFEEWCMKNNVASYSFAIEDIEEIIL